MKIGMILDKEFPPDPRVENEAISLIRNNFNVFLFSLNLSNRKNIENINNIRVYRYKILKQLYKKSYALAYSVPVYHYIMKSKIEDFIIKNKIDVIHIHDIPIAKTVFTLNKRWKLPLILDLHENRPEIMRYYPHVNSRLGKLLINPSRWAQKQSEFVKLADKLIVVTEEAKKDILRYQTIKEENIYVVPNTVTLDIFLSYPIDDKIIEKYKSDFVVLYLGSTGIRRGTDTAIISVRILKKMIKNLKLVLVGNSRDDVRLKKLAEDLNVKENVVFEGWQNVTLFPSFIKASEVCISPLVRNRHHDTTYANKLFQYMSIGKPVVASDCVAQRNLVNETNCGLIHKAGDEKELAEKIIQLYENPELRKQLGENGKKAVLEKYNWENTSKNLIELYEKIGEAINES